MRRWVSGLAALALGAIAVSPARADPPLWRVSDADTEMVLFGSIHALPEGLEWRTAELDAALASADLVVFEILEPKSEAEEFAMMAPMMRYLIADRPLSQVVAPETMARVRDAARKQGVDPAMIDMFRPWAAALMLDMGAEETLGRSMELGVDSILEGGLAEGRRTEALDTPALLETAMAALAETPDAEAEQMLIEVLDGLDRTALDLELENAWVAGDLEPVAEEMRSMREEAPRLYQVILVDRNQGWMPALKRMMQTEGRVVVVAGLAHMVGEDGLPALLRQAGYKVDGP